MQVGAGGKDGTGGDYVVVAREGGLQIVVEFMGDGGVPSEVE